MEQKLWYQTPAKKFSEALPIGNGSLGAMVYGDFPDFHYSLNADTLWSGRPGQKEAVEVNDETRTLVKELLRNKEYAKAQQAVQDKMTGKQYNESYLGAGFLHLEFTKAGKEMEITRELSLETACAKTKILTDNGSIQIESFVSETEDVLITHLISDKPISLSIGVKSQLHYSVDINDVELELCGEAPVHVEPNYVESKEPVIYGGGMKFSILNRAKSDGCLSEENEKFIIGGATELTLYTAIATGFRGYDQPLEKDKEVLTREGRGKIQEAVKFDYDELRERHVKAYRSLFERVSLCINDSDEESRVYELLFQYGRYLMISSSRMCSPYSQPSNLQGIWCEDVRSVWSSNFTVNINTEMNYWLTGPCALSECDMPLVSMLRGISDLGRETAQKTCGCDGWAACHNVDIWRHTAPVKGEAKWAYWPMGGVWLSIHLYQHYLYTNDLKFLAEQAYPIMREAAKFCMGLLYEEDGMWYTIANTSPENTFRDGLGQECCISRSVTMDHALIRELLQDSLQAGQVLKATDEFIQQMENALVHLPEYKVGMFGQLLEWEEDFKEVDVHHRHFAHLVGFHPFSQIDFETRTEFLPAVRQVLKRRTEGMKYEIGWNEAWLTNFYARLRDGEHAKEHLDLFLRYCTYPNLLGLHPPLGESVGEREIFQIDGNFGITAGIMEMLLYSKPGYICILPALPSAWMSGAIQGIITPGGHKVSVYWEHSKLTEAHLKSGKNEEVTIVYSWPFSVAEEVMTDASDRNILAQEEQKITKSTREEDGYYKLTITLEKDTNVKVWVTD